MSVRFNPGSPLWRPRAVVPGSHVRFEQHNAARTLARSMHAKILSDSAVWVRDHTQSASQVP